MRITADSGEARERERRGCVLLRLARRKLEEVLGVGGTGNREAIESEPWLDEEGATFVTLKSAGALRGCIGTLEAHRPLRTDVRSNVHSAAFNDPRFPPLTAEELPDIEIEVSLLSPVEPIEFEAEEDLLAQLRPGIDGLVLESGFHRGTFLPQVWDQLPDPRDFLRALKRKAGLSVEFWSPEIQVSRYTVSKWREEEGLES